MNAKTEGAPEQPTPGKRSKKNGKKRMPLPLRLFLILLIITGLLCGTVMGLWLYGRHTLHQQVVSAPVMDGQDSTVLEQYTVERNGKHYRYKDGMVNLLLIGVDSDNKPEQPLPYGNNNQADVILLAALDTNQDKMTLISISRDTMCDLAIPNEDGTDGSVANAQLALSYSYGDGLDVSCQLCQEAVSNLFHGLPINGYAAFYMGEIGALNDAVGGVSVTVLDDYPFAKQAGCENMTPGSQVTLTGPQATAYVRSRTGDAAGNEGRMQRQKQFLLSMIRQTKEELKRNPTKALSLYNSFSSHLLSDVGASKLIYLATETAGMQFSDDILKVTGTSKVGKGSHVELTPDEDALYDLMLQVFYEEYTPEAEQ